MNFQEILEADIMRYDDQQCQSSLRPKRDQSVKTNVDFRRNALIGEIFTKHFPGIQCFRPQLNRNANDEEFKLFEQFLEKISKSKTVQNAWKQMLENKRAMSEIVVSEAENGSDLYVRC